MKHSLAAIVIASLAGCGSRSSPSADAGSVQVAKSTLIYVASALLVGALVIGGCWMELAHRTGYATLRWTIGGRAEANDCARYGAVRVEIRAVDEWGDVHASAEPRCDAFEATLELEEGLYHAELALIDDRGLNVSNTVSTGGLRVVHHRSTVVAVAFPDCSDIASLAADVCVRGNAGSPLGAGGTPIPEDSRH
jgi:hypothetical protein